MQLIERFRFWIGYRSP